MKNLVATKYWPRCCQIRPTTYNLCSQSSNACTYVGWMWSAQNASSFASFRSKQLLVNRRSGIRCCCPQPRQKVKLGQTVLTMEILRHSNRFEMCLPFSHLKSITIAVNIIFLIKGNSTGKCNGHESQSHNVLGQAAEILQHFVFCSNYNICSFMCLLL